MFRFKDKHIKLLEGALAKSTNYNLVSDALSAAIDIIIPDNTGSGCDECAVKRQLGLTCREKDGQRPSGADCRRSLRFVLIENAKSAQAKEAPNGQNNTLP